MCYLQSVPRISSLPLALLLPALLAFPVHAADRSLSIVAMEPYRLEIGPQSEARSFDYLVADELGLQAVVDISGLEEGRQEELGLFLAVFREEDEDRRRPVVKTKRSERCGPGRHSFSFDEFMDADAWFGNCSFVAVLEASLPGAGSVELTRYFTIEGPPFPEVSFDEIDFYSWEDGPNYPDLEPWEEFVVDLTLSVSGNETGLDPRLRLLAVMEDDLWFLDPEDPDISPGPNWSEAWLHGGQGQWRVWARGRMPRYFDRAYDYYHDFRIYAFVSFGENSQRVLKQVSGTLTDPDNGELRVTDNIMERLVEISAAGHWNISQLKESPDG